jgi:hypothetical protein
MNRLPYSFAPLGPKISSSISFGIKSKQSRSSQSLVNLREATTSYLADVLNIRLFGT